MEISNENNGSEYIAVKAQTSGVQRFGYSSASHRAAWQWRSSYYAIYWQNFFDKN